MILTGLVSVTFRKLEPAKIIELVKRSGLQGIEWGGDVHVPHGNIQRAKDVLQMTLDAGLQVASYGSYYKAGCDESTLFDEVLETAIALRAPTIRVWAGTVGSKQADADMRRKVSNDSRRIAGLAAQAGINIAFEYHEETLTDNSASACQLLKEIDQANAGSYWQPLEAYNPEARVNGLREIAPWLSHIHVYNPSGTTPGPLAEDLAEWVQFMEIIRGCSGNRFCLIEFVKGDFPDQFLEDAEALKIICS